MLSFIQWLLVAALLIAAVICFTAAVSGVWRFGFFMSRMHSADVGDTRAFLLVILAAVVATGFHFHIAKLLLLLFFLWFTGPISSHFLGQTEYYTNPDLYDYVAREESGEDMEVIKEEEEMENEKQEDSPAGNQEAAEDLTNRIEGETRWDF